MFHNFIQANHRQMVLMILLFFFIFRYRSMGLTTIQSREKIVRMKVLKEMNRSGVDNMRTKMAMKSNVIRNLPKNVPY